MGGKYGYNTHAVTWTIVLNDNSFAVDFNFFEFMYAVSQLHFGLCCCPNIMVPVIEKPTTA